MNFFTLQKNKGMKRGFTLIEMMVSLSVFSIVLLFSLSSIVSVLDANHKSQTLRTVMDNLNTTLDTMTRKIRFSTNYHCGTGPAAYSQPQDCTTGDSSFTFLALDGSQVTYKLVGGQIVRDVDAS